MASFRQLVRSGRRQLVLVRYGRGWALAARERDDFTPLGGYYPDPGRAREGALKFGVSTGDVKEMLLPRDAWARQAHLTALPVLKLRALARESGVKNYGRMKKTELIEYLVKALVG